MARNGSKTQPGREPRHWYILNPHPDVRCTRCPQCEALMKARKIPLLIHVKPQNLLTLRKTVKLCPTCDLLIVHQDELERELVFHFTQRWPHALGNPYEVLGTMDVRDWKEGLHEQPTLEKTLERYHPFRGQMTLEATPGGWVPADETSKRTPKKQRP